jgi:hypothetical protein
MLAAFGIPRWAVMALGVVGIYFAVTVGAPWAWNKFIAEPYRQEGRVEVQKRWDAAVIAEADRVAKAVAEAQAEAQKTIDALEKKEEELNAELEKARAEADNDPNATRLGIGRDSVRRIGRVR